MLTLKFICVVFLAVKLKCVCILLWLLGSWRMQLTNAHTFTISADPELCRPCRGMNSATVSLFSDCPEVGDVVHEYRRSIQDDLSDVHHRVARFSNDFVCVTYICVA